MKPAPIKFLLTLIGFAVLGGSLTHAQTPEAPKPDAPTVPAVPEPKAKPERVPLPDTVPLTPPKADAYEPEISLPKEWIPLDIPKDAKPEEIKGLLKGGTSEDGKMGALLSIITIKKEKFETMKDPLQELGWMIREGDKKTGYTPNAERELDTALGKARVINSTSPNGQLQTWVILQGNRGVFLKLHTHELNEMPSQIPELKKILQSLKIPALPEGTRF